MVGVSKKNVMLASNFLKHLPSLLFIFPMILDGYLTSTRQVSWVFKNKNVPILMLCKALGGRFYQIQAHAWLHLTDHYFDKARYGTWISILISSLVLQTRPAW
jgi:mannose/cellobiose epimerase-like protein (N-acyl-D-glucosamine 2-epimerase family)